MKSVKFIVRLFVFFFVIIPFVVQSTVFALAPEIKTTEIILYAKPVSTGTGDCTTWSNACELRVALLDAEADQIWVASGTHLPTITDDREISFQLRSGVAIYGGFPSDGGAWESRDWQNNVTILSGDIETSGDNSDNSYHVVYAYNVNSTSVLDGFTISGGNASGTSYPSDRGGGIYSFNSTVMIKNVTVTNNSATQGGGIFNSQSNLHLMNINFHENEAGWGGAIFNSASSPVLSNVSFSNNSANYGAGMYNISASNPTITNTIFYNNSAVYDGGGISNQSSHPALINVTFSENSAKNGGAIFNNVSLPILKNVTIYGNSASLYGGGINNNNNSHSIITNSIIWDNEASEGLQIYNNSSSPTVTYSDIQGSFSGEGNINEDPLLGILSDNGGLTETHALQSDSPAIDTGNPDPTTCPLTDQRGYYRPIDGDDDGITRCDMGAYEYGSLILQQLYLPLVQK